MNYVRIAVQIGLLYGIFLVGKLLVFVTGIPLPGNVVGMLILFILLVTKVIPVSWIEEGAGLLLKHLAFFFIPIAVGVMAWGNLFSGEGFLLAGILIVSAGLSIIMTGWAVQILRQREEGGS